MMFTALAYTSLNSRFYYNSESNATIITKNTTNSENSPKMRISNISGKREAFVRLVPLPTKAFVLKLADQDLDRSQASSLPLLMDYLH